MGQSVTVIAKPSSNPEVVRFEINRSLTGMGHERYRSLDDIVRDRPVDVLARRLLEHGGVDAVHVNSSVITIDLAGGSTGQGLQEVIENLFRFYGDDDPGAGGAGEVEAGDGDGADDTTDRADAGGSGDDEAVAAATD